MILCSCGQIIALDQNAIMITIIICCTILVAIASTLFPFYFNRKKRNELEKGKRQFSDKYTITEIEEIVRKQDQSICNSLHKATKIFILRRYGELENPSDSLRTHLAQLEYERWIAYS